MPSSWPTGMDFGTASVFHIPRSTHRSRSRPPAFDSFAAHPPSLLRNYRKPKKTIYLSGPMTGKPKGNHEAFAAATRDLRSRGFKVYSPHELDKACGISSHQAENLAPEKYADVLLEDLRYVRKADEMQTLPGAYSSKGARTEIAYARALGIPVKRYVPTLPHYIKPPEVPGVFAELARRQADARRGGRETSTEERIVNAATGGAKGRKPQRFELLPWTALGRIAEVYAHGAKKYDAHNWRKGYDWSLSFGALQRHLAAFWNGEDNDPESGLPHVAHAGFHILSLLTFMAEHADMDDRFKETA